MEGFTAQQASELTGCTAHQLRYWDRIGLAKPSVQATGGRPGVRRLYSFRDLVGLKVIRSLLEGGMSLQKVRRAFEYLRKRADLDQQLSSVRLMTDGRSIFELYRSENQIMDALREGQLAFFMTLDDVVTRNNGRSAQYLYDRESLMTVLKRLESRLERDIDPAVRNRLRAAR